MQRQASGHTIAAYRDTMRLLLDFMTLRTGRTPSRLGREDLDAEEISAFPDHLQAERASNARTRNARMTAIRSLFHYASLRHPEHAAVFARVLAIPVGAVGLRGSVPVAGKSSPRRSPRRPERSGPARHSRSTGADHDAQHPARQDVRGPMHAEVHQKQAECANAGGEHCAGEATASDMEPGQPEVEGYRGGRRERRVGRRHGQPARVDECERRRGARTPDHLLEQPGKEPRGDHGEEHAGAQPVPVPDNDVPEARECDPNEDGAAVARDQRVPRQLIPKREAMARNPGHQRRVEPGHLASIGPSSALRGR
jgi:hypothetical protein